MSNDPDSQVGQTIGLMREKVAEDSADPQFMARAREVVNPQGVEMGQGWITHQCWEHVRHAIKFTRDELTGVGGDGMAIGGGDANEVVEVLIRPRDMAQYIDQGMAIGDCDDFSMYMAAMLKANGVDCAFCTVAANSLAPNQYSHVYVVAYPDGDRVPCDASHGEYCGWEVGNVGRLTEWPVWDKVRLFLGTVVTDLAVAAGLWYGWQYLKREWTP